MDNYLYKCNYCGGEYKPNKRGVQKFCSTSCRVNSHNKNKKSLMKSSPKLPKAESLENIKHEETVNAAGIINSAIGAGIVEASKAIFTHPENKPATKNDIKNLISQVQERYKPILNMPPNVDGTKPFYDMVQMAVLYLAVKN